MQLYKFQEYDDGNINIDGLPNELIEHIALNLSAHDIYNFGLSFKRCHLVINNIFWRRKIIRDYHFDISEYEGNYGYLYYNFDCAWGFGDNEYGQLGVYRESNIYADKFHRMPKKIGYRVKDILCGNNTTLLVDLDGKYLFCGIINQYKDDRLNYVRELSCVSKCRPVCIGNKIIFLDVNGVAKSLTGGSYLSDYFDKYQLELVSVACSETRPNVIKLSSSAWYDILIDDENNVWIKPNFDNCIFATVSFPIKLNLKALKVSNHNDFAIILDVNNNILMLSWDKPIWDGFNWRYKYYQPISISNIKVKNFSGSDGHIIIIDIYDNVWSVGCNKYGQLGLDDTINRKEFVQIPKLKAHQVSVGDGHSVVIDLNLNVWTFGCNQKGQLGLGDTVCRLMPTQIPKFKARHVSTGDNHTLLIGTRV